MVRKEVGSRFLAEDVMQWMQRTRGEWPAALVFFPLAVFWAGLVVPLSVLALLAPGAAPAALLPPLGHAHELLAGFALAVVFGFLVNRISPVWLACAFACWLAARLLFLWQPWHWAAFLANLLFGLLLIRFAAMPFLRTARKWRNQAVAPILIVLSLLPAVIFVHADSGLRPELTRFWVLVFALLMLFMAGRIMAPAFAGVVRRQGAHLQNPVQVALEGWLLIAALSAVLTGMLGITVLSGLWLLNVAVLALLRFLRWKPWRVIGRADLAGLCVGYLWLVVGTGVLGWQQLSGAVTTSAALHLVTVGALGTLSVTVMARSWCQKLGLGIPPAGPLWLMPLLLAAATLARVLGGPVAWPWAAAAWSAACLVLLGLFFSTARRASRLRASRLRASPVA